MAVAYLSLGSNVGDRLAHLRDAIERLRQAGARVVRVSSVYEAAYVGDEPGEVPDYLNCAAQIETEMVPTEILAVTQTVERAGGRNRGRRHAPRTIDIDILTVDAVVIQTPDLTLPHPRMRERAFVLAPLADIAPHMVLPEGGRAEDLLREPAIAAQKVRRVGPLALPADAPIA